MELSVAVTFMISVAIGKQKIHFLNINKTAYAYIIIEKRRAYSE